VGVKSLFLVKKKRVGKFWGPWLFQGGGEESNEGGKKNFGKRSQSGRKKKKRQKEGGGNTPLLGKCRPRGD